MKAHNEAQGLVKKHHVEHILYCLSVKPDELDQLKHSDPERYEAVVGIREAVGKQLARNTRNVSD
jgi:hypothetical protein